MVIRFRIAYYYQKGFAASLGIRYSEWNVAESIEQVRQRSEQMWLETKKDQPWLNHTLLWIQFAEIKEAPWEAKTQTSELTLWTDALPHLSLAAYLALHAHNIFTIEDLTEQLFNSTTNAENIQLLGGDELSWREIEAAYSLYQFQERQKTKKG